MTAGRRTAEEAGVEADRLIEVIRKRLSNNEQIRRNLLEWGRISIDRQLPFLCVYRRPPRAADPGTESDQSMETRRSA